MENPASEARRSEEGRGVLSELPGPPEPLRTDQPDEKAVGARSTGQRPASETWRRLRRNTAAVVSLLFLAGLGLTALSVPFLPLQPPRRIDTARQFLPPQWREPAPRWLSAENSVSGASRVLEEQIAEGFGRLDPVSRWLLGCRLALFGDWSIPSVCGTDKLGRDLLSRLLWGARVSLAVGIIAALVSVVIGVTYGATAGYIGGWVDELLMRFVDVLYSIPFIFIVIFLITVLSAETTKLRHVAAILRPDELTATLESDAAALHREKSEEMKAEQSAETAGQATRTSGNADRAASFPQKAESFAQWVALLDGSRLPKALRAAVARYGPPLDPESTVKVVDPGRRWRIEQPTGRAYLLERANGLQLYLQTRERWVTANRMVIFYFVVGAIYWLTMARVVRGQVISLKNEGFVEAARTVGASQARVLFRHILPNLWGVVIVYLTLTIPRVMLFEAFLSFLGLGVEPPDVSWGLLANEGLQVITPIKTYWWLVVFPSLALGLALLALNFLGDGLRDALDPRLRNRV